MNDFLISRSAFLDALILDADNKTDLIQVHHALEKAVVEDTNVPNKWISVEERLPTRTNPMHARDTFLVRLESGHIMTLSYEYDNSDRCTPGMVPLFDEGWAKTVVPVTHWMPLPAPPKENA